MLQKIKHTDRHKLKLKKVNLFLLLLVLNTICFAEVHTTLETKQNQTSLFFNENFEDSISMEKEHSPIILKIPPFHIMNGDFITKSLSIGFSMEKIIKTPYSLHLGARYIFTDQNNLLDKRWLWITVEQVNGFAVDAELRKYLGKENFGKLNSEMSGAYLSANLKNVYTQSKYSGSIVNRFYSGTYINIGWQEICDSGIVIDIAIGGGLRYVNSSNDIFFGDSTYHIIMDGGRPKPYHTGSALFPFVNINFNLGYIFKIK